MHPTIRHSSFVISLLGLCTLCLALFSAGCASLTDSTLDADKVQNFLTNVLPPDFVGDVHVAHVNPYFDFGIDATNVHKNAAGKWTWDGFGYNRSDFFHTKGLIQLVPKGTPAAVIAPMNASPSPSS